jgi:hypothetical protein
MTQTKDTAVRLVEAFNAHNESALRTLLAPDTSLQAPGGVHLRGREAATDYMMAWLNGFRDARMIVRHQIVSGPWVILEFTLEGTHTAALKVPNGTIAPTGKKLIAKGVHIGRYDNGLAVDIRFYYDQVDVLTQLDQMPALTASSS